MSRAQTRTMKSNRPDETSIEPSGLKSTKSPVVVASKDQQLASGGRVEQPDRAVRQARGDPGAIRAERDLVRGGAGQGCKAGSALHVPDLRRPVPTRGNESTALGGEGEIAAADTVDRAHDRVQLEIPDRDVRLQTRDLSGWPGGHRHGPAIGAEQRSQDLVAVVLAEDADLPARTVNDPRPPVEAGQEQLRPVGAPVDERDQLPPGE